VVLVGLLHLTLEVISTGVEPDPLSRCFKHHFAQGDPQDPSHGAHVVVNVAANTNNDWDRFARWRPQTPAPT
jgi:hypothetical protein